MDIENLDIFLTPTEEISENVFDSGVTMNFGVIYDDDTDYNEFNYSLNQLFEEKLIIYNHLIKDQNFSNEEIIEYNKRDIKMLENILQRYKDNLEELEKQ